MKAKAKAGSGKKRGDQKLRALLFDFGGTLAFLDYELLAREFSREGRKIDALALEHAEYAGRAAIDKCLASAPGKQADKAVYDHFFRGWMAAAGIGEEEMRECAARFGEIHREASLWRVVRAGTIEALEGFKSQGFKLGIVSNAEGRIEADAKRFGLAKYFDVIIDSHVVGVAKPDPRIFQIALERLGVGPDEARFAGDIYSIDVEGARAAGIEARLIDQHQRYDWVEHEKIRHVVELHRIEEPNP
jgi:putative hydrolase of the HAD superfamily